VMPLQASLRTTQRSEKPLLPSSDLALCGQAER
jgi:hypothetical protein